MQCCWQYPKSTYPDQQHPGRPDYPLHLGHLEYLHLLHLGRLDVLVLLEHQLHLVLQRLRYLLHLEHLEHLLNPRGIAVVGASEEAGRPGAQCVQGLCEQLGEDPHEVLVDGTGVATGVVGMQVVDGEQQPAQVTAPDKAPVAPPPDPTAAHKGREGLANTAVDRRDIC